MKYIINMPEDTKQHFDEFKGKFLCGDGYDLIQSIKDSKPLEQELDKIRAEIKQLPTTTCTETYRMQINTYDFKENVIAIIDKYKAKK